MNSRTVLPLIFAALASAPPALAPDAAKEIAAAVAVALAAQQPPFMVWYFYILPTLLFVAGLAAMAYGQYRLNKGSSSHATFSLLDSGMVLSILGVALFGQWGCLVVGVLMICVAGYLYYREGLESKVYISALVGVVFLMVGIVLVLVNKKGTSDHRK